MDGVSLEATTGCLTLSSPVFSTSQTSQAKQGLPDGGGGIGWLVLVVKFVWSFTLPSFTEVTGDGEFVYRLHQCRGILDLRREEATYF